MLQKAQIVIDQLTADWEKLKQKKGVSQKQVNFKMYQINTLVELYNLAEGGAHNTHASVQSNMIAMFAFELLRANKYDARVITDLLNRGSWKATYSKVLFDVENKLWLASDVPGVTEKVFSGNLPVKRVIDFFEWNKLQKIEVEKEARAMIFEIIDIINSSIQNGIEKAN